MNINSNIQYLKGVGEKRAQAYKKLGIATVNDLLYHFPRRYIDLSAPFTILGAPYDLPSPVKATLSYKSGEQRIRKGLSIFKLLAYDETGDLEVTVFNNKYLVQRLETGKEYIFYGRVEGSLLKRKMSSPEVYPARQTHDILPVYNQTAGVTTRLIRSNVKQCLDELAPLSDPVPEEYRVKYNLGEINSSMANIHFPSSMAAASFARDRFIFSELLTLSLALNALKSQRAATIKSPYTAVDLTPFYNSLPYTPTSAQYRCIAEAAADMAGNIPMNRLVQGDVGSGKTMVAAGCIYFVYKNGGQSALMVPTEILAQQHYETLVQLLAHLGVNVALLTGSTRAKERREILSGLENGTIDLCIGTHALLSDNVTYKNLGLVVTDEQHRFGVAQRAALSDKSENTHVLVMSATPIPRTLSLIIYGDLSLSVLDELPAGRQKIDTLLIDSPKLKRAMGFIRKNLDAGRQAYVVTPLIEQGDVDMGLKPAVDYYEELAQGEFKNYRIGLLHGKMKPKDKEKIMSSFLSGEIQLLVATTVIEVGIDVPNATIMLIQNAERFGLSQLHQLRGRVGRGRDKSYCILVSDSQSELALKRLAAMKTIDDGFKLAEYDLKLRGPGDFFGQRQHGLPALKVADLAENMDILEKAQDCAGNILSTDPTLSSEEHQLLKRDTLNMMRSVGERPN